LLLRAAAEGADDRNLLLDTHSAAAPAYLPANWQKFAEDAAQANLSYDRYLQSLAEQEIAQREKNREERRIKAARFPVLKELADFDFSCVSSLNKLQVLELAHGS
jgi:DNA replication protein DnaC